MIKSPVTFNFSKNTIDSPIQYIHVEAYYYFQTFTVTDTALKKTISS